MCYSLGLKRQVHQHIFTEVMEKRLKELIKKIGNKEIAQIFNRDYPVAGSVWTVKHITKKMKNLNIKRTEKQLEYIQKNHQKNGSYQKGAMIYSLRHRKLTGTVYQSGRYWYIKLEKGKMLYHHKIWIDQYGAIPEGKMITFKDRDSTNCAIENLVCVNYSELSTIVHAQIKVQKVIEKQKHINTKSKIINQRNKIDSMICYAKEVLGYKHVAEAISKLGKNDFVKKYNTYIEENK